MHSPPDPAPRAADDFDAALDDLLRAWSNGENPSPDEHLRRHPALGADIAALFELAQEIAVFRPKPMPIVPGFELLEEIGRGGMGVVYRSLQQGVDRTVALKVLPEAIGIDAAARARFLAEARGLGRVRHAHIVTIHGVVETSDVVAYAMDWIDGRSLASLLEELADWPRRDPAPPIRFGGDDSARLPDPAVPWFCRVGIALGRAVGEMHRHGLVHRDVKPGNVLLRADGTALLSDFGLVQAEALGLTRTGQIVGTPAFAAPEQLRAGELGPAADVYALGATLHCAFTGDVPFAGRNPLELLAAIEARRRRPLTASGLPRDLETIVAQCLEPEPRDRYATADAVADDLENLLALRPVSARRLGWASRCVRAARRNRAIVFTAALSALVVLAAAIVTGWWLWERITLARRFDEALLAARFALLEPTHEERVEIARKGQESDRITAFAASGDASLLAYEQALRLDPRPDIRLERDVVAAAQLLLHGQEPRPGPELRAAAPLTVRAMQVWAAGGKLSGEDVSVATRADRRCLGLLGFLAGHTDECHAAWLNLELANDPFVDAAAGQMHLQLGEIGPAYARLALAAFVWPDAGFLAVSMADCAVQLGDLDVAARQLARSRDLDHKDPFESHLRVEADLHAARGQDEEARTLYEQVIARHFATAARLHYLPVLRRTGNQQRLVEILLDLEERGVATPSFDLPLEAWKWWQGLGFDARVAAIEGVLDGRASLGVLGRLHALRLTQTDSPESSTARNDAPSLEEQQARVGLRFLLEMTMPRDPSVFMTNPAYEAPGIDSAGVIRGPYADTARLAAVLGAFCGMDPSRGTAHAFAATCLRAITRSRFLLLALAAMLPAPAQTVRWTSSAPAGAGPSPRSNFMTATDPATGDVLVYGGTDQTTIFADFWRWNGSTWSLIADPAPPGPISAGCMVNITSSNEVLVFGGSSAPGSPSVPNLATWTWNGSTWNNVTPLSSPPRRAAFGMAYDAWRDKVVVFGGQGSTSSVYLNDTWEWDPATATWTNRTASVVGNPGGLQWLGMAYDRCSQRVVVHGGRTPTSTTTFSPNTWTFDGTTWVNVSSATPGRYGAAMAWDEARQRLVQFGGRTTPTTTTNTILEWDSTSSTWLNATIVSPTAPTARAFVPMVHHPAGSGMVVFGGLNSASPLTLSSDTWTFTPDCPPRVDDTGPGCNPGAPLVPQISRVCGSGPWVGTTLDLDLTNLPGFPSFTFWFVDTVNPTLPLPGGCTLLTGLSHSLFGTTQFSLPIPNSPVYCGAQFYFQTVSLNLLQPVLAPGFITAMSNGLRVTIGTR